MSGGSIGRLQIVPMFERGDPNLAHRFGIFAPAFLNRINRQLPLGMKLSRVCRIPAGSGNSSKHTYHFYRPALSSKRMNCSTARQDYIVCVGRKKYVGAWFYQSLLKKLVSAVALFNWLPTSKAARAAS